MTFVRIMSDFPSPNCPLNLSILAMTFSVSLTNVVVSAIHNPLFAPFSRLWPLFRSQSLLLVISLWPILVVVLDDGGIPDSHHEQNTIESICRILRIPLNLFDLFTLGADKLGISHQTLLFKSSVKIVHCSVHVCFRLCTNTDNLSQSEEQDDRFWVRNSVYQAGKLLRLVQRFRELSRCFFLMSPAPKRS